MFLVFLFILSSGVHALPACDICIMQVGKYMCRNLTESECYGSLKIGSCVWCKETCQFRPQNVCIFNEEEIQPFGCPIPPPEPSDPLDVIGIVGLVSIVSVSVIRIIF